MVRLHKTEIIKEALALAIADSNICESIKNWDLDESFITHEQLIFLSQSVGQINDRFRLSRLVHHTKVFIPAKPPPIPKSKEFLQQMEQLRHKSEEFEYQNLISSSSSDKDQGTQQLASQEIKQVKEQISAIINVLVSVVSVAWALWHWSGSSTSSYSLAGRTLLSLFGALVILVAEVVIYSGYKARVEEARVTERKKKENKTVITTFEFGNSRSKLLTNDLPTSPAASAASSSTTTTATNNTNDLRQRKLIDSKT